MTKTKKNLPGKRSRPGALVLGKVRNQGHHPFGISLVFRCRKNGYDFLGQIRIQSGEPAVRMEIFNRNYFLHFDEGEEKVRESLETLLFLRLLSHGQLPADGRSLIQNLLEAKTCSSPLAERGDDQRGKGLDLEEIYTRLNSRYFDGKVKAKVVWGRNSKTPNRRTFRFGSYDPSKKLIRIHPRLNQDFVPLSVVELTIYHEMCHQWLPSVKKNGMWQSHHAKFKKKEREYHDYGAARGWEKQNWQKLLKP